VTLSARLMSALENLADKQAGKDVDWINIADARALTELGFAQRSREGWDITAAGVSELAARSADGADPSPPDRGR
jgi:hypothetical protein